MSSVKDCKKPGKLIVIIDQLIEDVKIHVCPCDYDIFLKPLEKCRKAIEKRGV